jgi:hypothetical protein
MDEDLPTAVYATPSEDPPAGGDEDCYFDGPFMVFTAAYHLKRGYCCESGCRHCPYKDKK